MKKILCIVLLMSLFTLGCISEQRKELQTLDAGMLIENKFQRHFTIEHKHENKKGDTHE